MNLEAEFLCTRRMLWLNKLFTCARRKEVTANAQDSETCVAQHSVTCVAPTNDDTDGDNQSARIYESVDGVPRIPITDVGDMSGFWWEVVLERTNIQYWLHGNAARPFIGMPNVIIIRHIRRVDGPLPCFFVDELPGAT